MSARFAAIVVISLLAIVALFQAALVAGAPWGRFAMGGSYPGVYPPGMRLAALAQVAIYAACGVVVAARAGIAFPRLRRFARIAIWPLVVLFGLSLVLNLITPSGGERLIWAPVALVIFAGSLRVALA